MQRLTRAEMAARVARDIPEGACVNLGIGLPTLVADHLPRDKDIFLHSENGLLGMGPAPAPGDEDPDLINAGKQPVTLLPGGAYFHHADSFAMMRGGHLDQLAYRRTGCHSGRGRGDGPRHRRQTLLRDDGAPDP
jgi:3-oxoadipate CoA-transferase, beta subunit